MATILTMEQEADLISNLLSDPDDEIGSWSKRLLEIHYKSLEKSLEEQKSQ